MLRNTLRMINQQDQWFNQLRREGGAPPRPRYSLSEAREHGGRVLVHAAPPKLQVKVIDAAGNVVARGDGLERHQPGPMSFLVRRGTSITLEDGWPTEKDIGLVVILPGGEAGILKSWWNADDRKEWRWQVEVYNQNRG